MQKTPAATSRKKRASTEIVFVCVCVCVYYAALRSAYNVGTRYLGLYVNGTSIWVFVACRVYWPRHKRRISASIVRRNVFRNIICHRERSTLGLPTVDHTRCIRNRRDATASNRRISALKQPRPALAAFFRTWDNSVENTQFTVIYKY